MEMNDNELLKQTYQLARENNRMLHAMRRNAFFGGIIKLVIYAAMLFIPFWLYMQYLAPQIERMTQMMAQVQGAGNQASEQMSAIQKSWEEFKSHIPSLPSSTNK